MKSQEIHYPRFYQDLKQKVYAPEFYHSTSSKYRQNDEYSWAIYHAKRGEDKTEYFAPKIKDLVSEVLGKLNLKIQLVTIVPTHEKGKFHPTTEGVGKFLATHLNAKYEPVIERTRTIGKNHTIHSLHEHFKNINGSMKLRTDCTTDVLNRYPNIILLDDVKASGLSIMEATKVLIDAGAKKVIPVVLGINENNNLD